MRTIILLLPILMESAIVDTCLRYFTNIELQKNTCLECRDGYFLKSSLCFQCNKFIKNAECNSVKAFNYGSNIVTTPPALVQPLPNNNTNISNTNLTNPNLTNANLTNLQSKPNSLPITQKNYTLNSILNKQDNTTIVAQKYKFNQTQNESNSSVPSWGKLNSSSAPIVGLSTPQKLQNCKEVSSSGKCAKCFLGYEISNELCVKKRRDENRLENCFVFSQIQSQCVMCEDGYEVGEDGYCKSIFNVVQTPSSVKPVEIVGNKTEFNYAQAENVATLQKEQSNESQNSTNSPNNTNLLIGNKIGEGKSLLTDSQIDISPTTLSIFATERSFKLLLPPNISEAANSSSGNFVKDKQKTTPKPLITLENSNDSFIIKLEEDDGCLQYEMNNGKNCLKCIENYLLNPLAHKCMNLNKPIDLGKVSTPNPSLASRLHPPTADVIVGKPQNVSVNASKTQGQPQVQTHSQQAPTTTITIIVSNGNANSVINISTSTVKLVENGTGSIIINSDVVKQTTPKSVILVSNNSNTPISNGSSIMENRPVINVTSVSSNSSGGAIILPKTTATTTRPDQTSAFKNNTIHNNTTQNNVTLLGVPCSVSRCAKCRDGSNECGQCELSYQLYLGKCYDLFSYRLLVRSKMYTQAV